MIRPVPEASWLPEAGFVVAFMRSSKPSLLRGQMIRNLVLGRVVILSISIRETRQNEIVAALPRSDQAVRIPRCVIRACFTSRAADSKRPAARSDTGFLNSSRQHGIR